MHLGFGSVAPPPHQLQQAKQGRQVTEPIPGAVKPRCPTIAGLSGSVEGPRCPHPRRPRDAAGRVRAAALPREEQEPGAVDGSARRRQACPEQERQAEQEQRQPLPVAGARWQGVPADDEPVARRVAGGPLRHRPDQGAGRSGCLEAAVRCSEFRARLLWSPSFFLAGAVKKENKTEHRGGFRGSGVGSHEL